MHPCMSSEKNIAPWYMSSTHGAMGLGLIPHGGPIVLFLIPASATRFD